MPLPVAVAHTEQLLSALRMWLHLCEATMDMNGKANVLLIDDQPGKLISYEIMFEELNGNISQTSSANEVLIRGYPGHRSCEPRGRYRFLSRVPGGTIRKLENNPTQRENKACSNGRTPSKWRRSSLRQFPQSQTYYKGRPCARGA